MRLPQFTEQQGRALIGGIALLIAIAVAALIWGRDAAVAVIGIDVLWLLWNRADILERLTVLETLVVGMLPEEVDDLETVGGWPEEEPNPVEPPDEPITDEFPAITEPMRLGDEIEADFRAHQVHAEQAQTARRQMVEKTVGGMTFRVMEDVP